jgi:murein tripeptide amidase MpaA
MKVSSNFDGGNIECLESGSASNIRLRIVKDSNADFLQWFYFRLTDARDIECCLKIENAGAVSYPDGWKDYRAVASYDREHWFRVDTNYDGKVLTISHRPDHDSVYYAMFAPYSLERHADFLAYAQKSANVRLVNLGETLDGQDLDMLVVGENAEEKRKCWIVARQHPGETMASWWTEGFLQRLIDDHDPVARALSTKVVFYVVPNMNPDGSRRGNLRTNAAGANLNREWQEPAMNRSPEVFLVREKMRETGVDFCLDVHGDEALPYNFLAGPLGIPSLSEKQKALFDTFRTTLARINPDFQTVYGYPPAKPGAGNLTMCSNWVAEAFACLAMTLEQPFKDTADTPDPIQGWSPERCRKLGASCLDALYAIVDTLR